MLEAPNEPDTDVGTNPESVRVSRVQRDLLVEYGAQVVLALSLIAIGLLVASLTTGVRHGLPGVALSWLLGLQLIRAALAFGLIAAIVMLLIRGAGGLWPQRVSTSGFDFPSLVEGSREIERGSALAIQALRQLERYEQERL